MGQWHAWGEKRLQTRLWQGNMKERNPLDKLNVDGKIVLKWTVYSFGSGYGQVVGSCEHDNESLGSIKCKQFLH